jgi:pyruvate/2-oxoglutarate dehydrogenase complex dihydrolipoamide dehydrogenase (E3) component
LEEEGVVVKTSSSEFSGDAISAIGVSPQTELAEASGIEFDDFGIKVNDLLETSMKGVYAAGDCISERCFFTRSSMHSYLGPQADRQGVIAGTNAVGGELKYTGSLNQTVLKVGDIELGISGLSLTEAKKRGLEAFSVTLVIPRLPGYYKSEKTTISMCFSENQMVGLQAMGRSVEGLIDLASAMMMSHKSIEEIITFPYCFSPKVCNAPHPFILCAEKAKNKIKNG